MFFRRDVMKKIILTIVILAINITVYSQDTLSVMDKLMATTWKVQTTPDGAPDNNYLALVKYTETNKARTISYDDKSYTADIGDYYLNDSFDTQFDDSRVGKIFNGKYIITKNKKNSSISVFEIIKLDESELILKNLTNKSIIKHRAFKE